MSSIASEADIEKLVIDVCVANGWKYRPAAGIGRPERSVFLEGQLREALKRLNPCIAENPDYADVVVYRLRLLANTVLPHDLVTQNERFRKLVFEENSFPFGKDGRAVSVKFFDYDNVDNNDFVVTNQWTYPQSAGGKRLDVVLCVNGIPLVVGEIKTPFRPCISWMDGVKDISDYEKSIPQMFVTNAFNFACDGRSFRYGAVGALATVWGPWFAGIAHEEGTFEAVKKSMSSMLRPEVVLDVFRYFTVFSTDKRNRTIKVVARYQQYEGANMIIARTVENKIKKGLIWHFQGSGKSLLMVFAAQKMRMMAALRQPTVIIVNDRIDLTSQMSSTFTMADVPNLVSADSCAELVRLLKADTRMIILTTIFKFQDVAEQLNARDNIVVLVDEAHRTQEGNLGAQMRLALPNAFFFGLTGTPINKIDHNTFRTFGAVEDRSGYMSRYSFADSVRDKATLPLHFEPVPVKLHVNQAVIDEEFDRMAAEEGLTDEEKSKLAKHVKAEAIMKDPERIRAVCAHIAEHFMSKVKPNGFKGQVVCYDRECCVLYKEELDKLLGENASTIVMDTNNDKEGRYAPWRREPDEESRVLDIFRDPNKPLDLLIVTSKLLTGFDAPILQCMYLDKPMKDHTLLQAVCRTNRIYSNNGVEKAYGLVVDYVGIFDDVAKALNFDEADVRKIITSIEAVRGKIGELIAACVAFFPGVDRTKSDFDTMCAAQDCLPTNEKKDGFGAKYRVLKKVWEALSPDPCLSPYRDEFKWLSRVYETLRPIDDRGQLIWTALGPKTLELVHENVSVSESPHAVDEIELEAELIEKLIGAGGEVKKKARELEIKLIDLIRSHSKDDRYVALGKRVEELRAKVEAGLVNSVEFLKGLLELAKDAVALEREVVPEEEIDRGKAALTELFNGVKSKTTPVMVESVVKDIDGIVRIVRFDGWQDTSTGRNSVKRSLRDVIMIKYRLRDAELFNKAYAYVEQYY